MADAPNRHRIIFDQKQPLTYKVNYYELAQQPIIQYFLNGYTDEEILTGAIDRLYSTKPESDQEETKLKVNAEAIQSFLNHYDKIQIDELVVRQGSQDCPKVTIEGVDISVRPEIFLKGNYKGQDVTGAIKFYFGKNDPLTTDSGTYISSVIGRLVQEHFGESSTMSSRHCQAFDVFSGNVFNAPKSTTMRFRDIKYACKEIAMWWNALDDE